MDRPETSFAWNGDVALAFQVLGQADSVLLYIPGLLSNVDVMWESPAYARFLQRLASFSRVVVMDRRGVGCSERFSPEDVAPLEVLVEDTVAVLDALAIKHAAVFTWQETNFLSIVLAATHPDRISHLVLLEPSPSWFKDDEITWEWGEEEWQRQLELWREWGTLTPKRLDEERRWWMDNSTVPWDEREIRWKVRMERATQGPGAMVAETRKLMQTDVRRVLPAVHVPTLVVFRHAFDERSPRYVAEHIEGAKYVDLPGGPHQEPWSEGWQPLANEIEEFLVGTRHDPEPDRVLKTVMFTDIVESTRIAADVGDSVWRHVVETHHAIIRDAVSRAEGIEQDTAGDGFFVTVDGPARAVLCAQEILREVRPLGLEVRIGIHTGECEVIDQKVGGFAAILGARVMAEARPSEILVSQTVKDLVAGSGLTFVDAGEHELKGIPDRWHLYRAIDQ